MRFLNLVALRGSADSFEIVLQKRKTPQITARLGKELLARLESASDITGLDISTITKACIDAFCEEVEEQGGIWLPIKVIPKQKFGKSPAEHKKKNTLEHHQENGLPLQWTPDEETARVAEMPTEPEK